MGVDLDGVVADFNKGWIRRYNRDFGTDIADDAVEEWDAPVDLTHFAHMDAFWEWAQTCGEGASLFRWLEPYPGALDALVRLDAMGHRVVVLTTKPAFAIHDTYAWLSDNRFPTTEVHIVDNKATVTCDLYVDDADHNVRTLVSEHPASTVCRFVRPWNSPVETAVDVHTWDDIVSVVDRVAVGSTRS